jgi:hypothetical protein
MTRGTIEEGYLNHSKHKLLLHKMLDLSETVEQMLSIHVL